MTGYRAGVYESRSRGYKEDGIGSSPTALSRMRTRGSMVWVWWRVSRAHRWAVFYDRERSICDLVDGKRRRGEADTQLQTGHECTLTLLRRTPQLMRYAKVMNATAEILKRRTKTNQDLAVPSCHL